MVTKYVSIDRVFNKVTEIKPDGFNELDIIKWTGEALEHMQVYKMLEEAIAYCEVKDHQAIIPNWLHSIIQIARNTTYTSSTVDVPSICPINIITDNPVIETPEEEPETDDCCNPDIPSCYQYPETDGSYPVIINQFGEPLTEYELAYYRPYFDLKYDYLQWGNSNMYKNHFTPVRLANHSFFNTIVCAEDENIPYNNSEDEYTIIGDNILRFPFETGGVIIAYLRQRLDEKTGYPKIPDDVSVLTAIENYIRFQYAKQDFYAYKQGSEGRLAKAEQDWHWYCNQVKNKFFLPKSVDEWQNLLDQRNYLSPRNHYYGFFGHLSRPESHKTLRNGR